MGKWPLRNASNLICMLRCFYFSYGLKINVHKEDDILDMASTLRCAVSSLPFTYLGV